MRSFRYLRGRWQCRIYTPEQPSAAAGPANAAGSSSGARDKLANRASPSEILLEHLKKSETRVKVLRNTPTDALIVVANALEHLLRDFLNAERPARERVLVVRLSSAFLALKCPEMQAGNTQQVSLTTFVKRQASECMECKVFQDVLQYRLLSLATKGCLPYRGAVSGLA